jgi:predicted Zn-dependent protease
MTVHRTSKAGERRPPGRLELRVSLLPIVGTDRSALDTLAQDLSDRGFHVTVLDEREVPAGAYDPRRRQYRAQAFVDRARKESTGRVLAVTDLDLY